MTTQANQRAFFSTVRAVSGNKVEADKDDIGAAALYLRDLQEKFAAAQSVIEEYKAKSSPFGMYVGGVTFGLVISLILILLFGTISVISGAYWWPCPVHF